MSLAELVPTVESAALEVAIDRDVTEGLERHQIEAMQEAVFKINKGNAIYTVGAAKALYDLRNAIKGSKKNDPRQWTRFKKSGLVPFKPRDITDLVTAWEGWMSHSQLPPEKFNVMGIRTLFEVGTASPAIQKQVESMLQRNSRVTQKSVQDLKGNKAKKPRSSGNSTGANSLDQAKLRIMELEEENAKLRKLLDSNNIKYRQRSTSTKAKSKGNT